MSDPVDFYRTFQGLLRGRSIESVLTSGTACVEYGLQQNTKDTDWIVAPADAERLVGLFGELERGLSGGNWRVSYRGLFGAPLDPEYLAGGWTSHVAAYDRDRRAVLHLREPDILREAWRQAAAADRDVAVRERPLLAGLEARDDLRLERLLLVEGLLWQCVNRERYLVYQRAWKDFYRAWQQDRIGEWPTAEPFLQQHRRVCEAVRCHGLPPDPLGAAADRQAVYDQGRSRAQALAGATPEEMTAVAVPPGAMLL